MERLTEERGERTWKLFHVSWYVNIVLVIIALLISAGVFASAIQDRYAGIETDFVASISLAVSFLIIACVLLVASGVSRYQARTEGQHLELKMTIQALSKDIAEIRGSSQRD